MNVSAVLVAVVSLMLGACEKRDSASIKSEEVRHKEATSAEKARHLKEVRDIKNAEAWQSLKQKMEAAKATVAADGESLKQKMEAAKATAAAEGESLKQKMEAAKAKAAAEGESLKQKMEAAKAKASRWSFTPSANP